MKQLNEKLMTDEETDTEEPNCFIRRSLPWRSEKLNRLFKTLDERHDSKHDSSVRRNRKIGSPSERGYPKGLPAWSLSTPSTSLSTPTPSTSSLTPTPSPLISSRTSPSHITAVASSPQSTSSTPLHVENFSEVRDSNHLSFCNTPLSRRSTQPRTSFRSHQQSPAAYFQTSEHYENAIISPNVSEQELDEGDELTDWIHAVTSVTL